MNKAKIKTTKRKYKIELWLALYRHHQISSAKIFEILRFIVSNNLNAGNRLFDNRSLVIVVDEEDIYMVSTVSHPNTLHIIDTRNTENNLINPTLVENVYIKEGTNGFLNFSMESDIILPNLVKYSTKEVEKEFKTDMIVESRHPKLFSTLLSALLGFL